MFTFMLIMAVLVLLLYLYLIVVPIYNYKKKYKNHTEYKKYNGYISDSDFSLRPSSSFGSNGHYSQDFLSVDNLKDFFFG